MGTSAWTAGGSFLLGSTLRVPDLGSDIIGFLSGLAPMMTKSMPASVCPEGSHFC